MKKLHTYKSKVISTHLIYQWISIKISVNELEIVSFTMRFFYEFTKTWSSQTPQVFQGDASASWRRAVAVFGGGWEEEFSLIFPGKRCENHGKSTGNSARFSVFCSQEIDGKQPRKDCPRRINENVGTSDVFFSSLIWLTVSTDFQGQMWKFHNKQWWNTKRSGRTHFSPGVPRWSNHLSMNVLGNSRFFPSICP